MPIKKALTSTKTQERSLELATSSADLTQLWLEWQVVKDTQEDLASFNFKLVQKEISTTENHKVAIPILALYHLAEKYNWLQVLRGPNHRPRDPYELVHFIQMLDGFSSSK